MPYLFHELFSLNIPQFIVYILGICLAIYTERGTTCFTKIMWEKFKMGKLLFTNLILSWERLLLLHLVQLTQGWCQEDSRFENHWFEWCFTTSIPSSASLLTESTNSMMGSCKFVAWHLGKNCMQPWKTELNIFITSLPSNTALSSDFKCSSVEESFIHGTMGFQWCLECYLPFPTSPVC